MINNLKVSDSKILLCDVRCMTMNLIALGQVGVTSNMPVTHVCKSCQTCLSRTSLGPAFVLEIDRCSIYMYIFRLN